MGNNLIINIIGESMSGKSTFILNLIDEQYSNDLDSIIQENKSGQTKIKTKYKIGKYDDIRPGQIIINNQDGQGEKIINELGLKKDIQNPDNSDFIYADGGELEYNYVLKNIINCKGCNSKIESVEICAPARKDVLEIITKYSYDNLIFIDTRGFDDGIKEDLKKFDDAMKEVGIGEKLREVKKFEALLSERGITDSLLSVLFTKTSGLQLTVDKEIYKTFLMEVVKEKPLFVVSRSSMLTKAEKNGKEYIDLINGLKEGQFNNEDMEDETCLSETYDLINKSIKCKDDSYTYMVSKIKYLPIPNINKNSESYEQQRKIYLDNQIFVLNEMCKYYSEWKKNELDIVKKFNEKQFADKIFDEIKNGMTEYLIECVNLIKTNYDNILKKSFNRGYYGNFVGVKGGITTKINGEYVGQKAIGVIDSLYDAIYYSIEKLDVDGEIKKFLREKLNCPINKMLDPTITFGHIMHRRFCKLIYDKYSRQNNDDLAEFINKSIDIVLKEYKELIIRVSNE